MRLEFFTAVNINCTVFTQPPIQWVAGDSFPRDKADGAWSWPLTSI